MIYDPAYSIIDQRFTRIGLIEKKLNRVKSKLKTEIGGSEYRPKHSGYILKPLLVRLLKKKSFLDEV